MAPMCWIATPVRCGLSGRITLCWRPAAPGRYISTRPTPIPPPATASRWRGARVPHREHGIHPVPPHLSLSSACEVFSHQRGGARRGRRAATPRRARFMPWHDSRAELAPRDIVARAIDFEMKKRGLDCVYLDISHKPRGVPEGAFPQHLQALPGVRHRHHRAAHSGRARGPLHVRRHHDRPERQDRPGQLYAIGETAYTGLHGANRLASNSLLECLVFGQAAARDITGRAPGASRRAAAAGTRAA